VIDYIIILLFAFIILLIIQILSLLKIRNLVIQLKKLLGNIGIIYRNSDILRRRIETVTKIKKCQYCKYRQAFIKATPSGESDDFYYYRCKLHDINISLTYSCKQFEFESER
jgi:hypothetical protein